MKKLFIFALFSLPLCAMDVPMAEQSSKRKEQATEQPCGKKRRSNRIANKGMIELLSRYEKGQLTGAEFLNQIDAFSCI